MSKFSSFKDQQLISESWRKYNNLTEESEQGLNKPATGNAQAKQSFEQKPESEPEKPEQKDLKAFQNRQSAMTTVNPQIIAQKMVDYLKTLRGFDIQKNNQVVLNALQIIAKQLNQSEKEETVQKPASYSGEDKPETPPVKESIYEGAHLDDGTLVCEACLEELLENQRTIIQEAKYQGRTVTLNKPMKGDVKKSKVYVKDPSTGNIKKVNFGDKNMTIKKDNPARRKSFRARHKCGEKKDKTSAGYWSCKAW